MSADLIAWTIAGSDSGAGAGIQADIKTMQALSVYCCSVITAVTAQNTSGVFGIEAVSIGLIEAQIKALRDDLNPNAIKVGMLYSSETVETVARVLSDIEAEIVFDPVMIATSGDALVDQTAVTAMRKNMLPLADLITPNWAEAHILAGRQVVEASEIDSLTFDQYVEDLGVALLTLGPKSVLIKGGHTNGDFSQDYWTDGDEKVWLTSPKLDTTATHGTGCTLSAAIAAGLAKHLPMQEAIVIAKAYVNKALRLAPQLGTGNGPLAHLDAGFEEQDLPWISNTGEEGRLRPSFELHTEMGFYPIVPSSDWVKILATAGVKTMQLRMKEVNCDLLENEIVSAINTARQLGCSLYINDHWKLAIKHGAFGVHLGQEDLNHADVQVIAKSGLKLGISTHCFAEVARALSVRPSYIAIGPIYPTTTKQMNFAPQGKNGLAGWRRMLTYPLVAIGGITLELATEILEAGAGSISVVRDIVDHPNPAARAKEWLLLWEQC